MLSDARGVGPRERLGGVGAVAPRVGAGCLGIAAVVTHAVHGRVALGGRGYRAWMPFDGGPRFVLLHALAWTLCGVVADVLLAVGPGPVGRVAGGPATLGVAGVVANAVLWVALDYFEEEEAPKEAAKVTKTLSSSHYWGASPERAAASLFVVCSVAGFVAGGSVPKAGSTLRVYGDREVPPAYVMATVLAHLAAPLAHLGGARAVPGYRPLMVGVGGPKFVIAQGCGWMLYAVSLLATVVATLNPSLRNGALLVALAPLAVISSATLVLSVGLFEEDQTAVVFLAARSRAEARRSSRSDDREWRRAWTCHCDAAHFGALDTNAAAASAACADLRRLRSLAATPAARALLDVAAAALAASAASRGLDLPLDDWAAETDDDDDGFFEEDDDVVAEEQAYFRLAEDLAVDGGEAKRRRRSDAALQILGVAAAPLASALGVGLFATAESAAAMTQQNAAIASSWVSPALATCAFLATLAAAPLQFRLDRFRAQRSRPDGRFVALRLVALAAWSFAVLAAFAALLRYLACRGCGAISRDFFAATGAVSPLGLCGACGVGLQGVALLLGDDGDDAADGDDGKDTRRPPKRPKASLFKRDWRTDLALVLETTAASPRGGAAALPEDVWLLVEAHLRARDLATLGATAKRPAWCAAYARPKDWKRVFARRGIVPRRSGDNNAPVFFDKAPVFDATVTGNLRSLGDAYDRLEAMLDFAFAPPRRGVPAESRVRAASFRRGKDAPAHVALEPKRALGWKFACFLHDRGAAVLRCRCCGEVDDARGPNEFCLAACEACGAAGAAHRRCLERRAGLPRVVVDPSAESLAARDVGACPGCGARLAPGLRRPDGPRELASCLSADALRLAKTAATLAPRLLLCLAVAAHLEARAHARHRRLAAACGARGAWGDADADAATTFRPVKVAFALWMALQLLLFHLFASPAFSDMVSRIWRGPRDHVRLYLRLYAYYVAAAALVVAQFSPLAHLFATVTCGAPGPLAAAARAALAALGWLNLLVYVAVSGACLFLFAKANYHLLTVSDRL